MISEKHIEQLHASPWLGVVTEIGLGVPVIDALTKVDGCSKTLMLGQTPYNRLFQPLVSRSVSKEMAEVLALLCVEDLISKSQWGEHQFSLAVTGSFKLPEEHGETHVWVCLVIEHTAKYMHFTISDTWCELRRGNAINLAGAVVFYFMYAHMIEGGLDEFKRFLNDYPSTVLVDVIDSPLFPLVDQLALVNKDNPMVFKGGKATRVQDTLRTMTRIYRGSFNPPTKAHDVIGEDAVFEIGLTNARKPKADLVNVVHRIRMLTSMGKTVMVTDGTPLFIDLDETLTSLGVINDDLIYVMGDDTYYALAHPAYYGDRHSAGEVLTFLAEANIELVIDPNKFAERGLGESPWRGEKVMLSPQCENPELIHRSSSIRKDGLDHIHCLPEQVQQYIKEHNPYNFVEKT